MDAERAASLRWDGRPGWYEAWYLTVAGSFWFRRSLHAPSDGAAVTWSAWLVSFAGTTPSARKGPAPPEGDVAKGEVGEARWDLTLEPLAPPFELVHPLLRPLAKTKVSLVAPAVLVSGTVEVDGRRHELAGRPGTLGHVYGTRHADRWGWAHATLPEGRWVELLAAKVPRLPQVASFATERSRAAGLRGRGTVGPTALRVGPYTADVTLDRLAGVTYADPDGTPVYCYHAESARLRGPGIDAVAAFEYGARRPLPGVGLLV